MRVSRVGWLFLVWLGWTIRGAAAEAPLPVVNPEGSAPVEFRTQILPLLQANCLPCHNRTTTKGELLLETTADMLKGGENGPALVPGKAEASLLFRLARHEEKPRMPPRDNKVNAVDFTPEQLGLLARWIDQGAKEGDRGVEVVRWLPRGPELKAIYAVAITPDGQFVTAGRGNRLSIYHRPTRQRVAELRDPALDGVDSLPLAHRDMVGALAFRPDGSQLASGGFRELKLWRKIETAFSPVEAATVELSFTNTARSADGSRVAKLGTNGVMELWDGEGHRLAELWKDADRVDVERSVQRELAMVKSTAGAMQKRVEAADKEAQQQSERFTKAVDSRAKAGDVSKERQRAYDKAAAELKAAEEALAAVAPDATAEARKGLTNKIETARKPVEDTRKALEEADRKRAVSDDELRLAQTGVEVSRSRQELGRSQYQDLTNRVALTEARNQELATNLMATVPRVEAVAISPDARWVATVAGGDRLGIWSGATGEPIATWTAPAKVTALGLGTNQILQVRCGDQVYVRELLPGWELQRVIGGEKSSGPFADRVAALAYSPDGRWLASGSGEPSRSGDVHWWDPSDGSLLGSITNLHSDTVLSLAFSPDSSTLASGGADRFARLVDPGQGLRGRALEGHLGHVLSVAWKDDNATLASGSADLVVKFWDTVAAEKRKQATGYEREVTGVGFLTGDQWITVGSSRELRVINENGDKVRVLTGPKDATYALAVSSDGRWIVAGGEEGTLRVWDRDVEAPRWVVEEGPPSLSSTNR